MRFDILDFGYVQLVESWGSEESIIEAARMSTGRGFEGWEKDQKLLAYLYRNQHTTPFEMAGMIIEVKAPIFVFREWHRHRTQSYNEMSARYIPLPDEDYMPELELLLHRAAASTANKQAASLQHKDLTEYEAARWLWRLHKLYEEAQSVYEDGLELGVPKELARLAVPVARYSRMRASANLRNWLGFLTLRMAPNAQWEIRQYANAVGRLIEHSFPRTWALLLEQWAKANPSIPTI
jgi:thymidylate synthase (FAD)